MNVEFSCDANILSVWLSDRPVDHAEEAGPFIVHVAEDGEPVLIEILDGLQFLETSMSRILEAVRAAQTTTRR